MPAGNEEEQIEATSEQITRLRELGAREEELEDLNYAEAEEWIDELTSMREDAGKIGRDT